MSDRPGQVENNLVPTCKPLAWLVRRTSEFLIRKILKQLKIDSNYCKITSVKTELIPWLKIWVDIMVESQKVQKVQSSLLDFLSKQPRKENIWDACKEWSESREDH